MHPLAQDPGRTENRAQTHAVDIDGDPRDRLRIVPAVLLEAHGAPRG